jgi:hypothetical protein
MRSRTGSEILAAYKHVRKQLCLAGLCPILQRLDNECSAALKEHMLSEGVNYQLGTPGVHHRNVAERAIRTFKNHFIAALCGLDKNAPLHLWDRLLPQTLLPLNLLRGSWINPKLSAWAQVHGPYDYNCTPIAPLGTLIVAHEKSAYRKT